MLGAAPAMQVGANKYGPFNWRQQPVQAMTYAEAILRHLLAWIDGQDVAEDTGISHLGHIAAGVGILLDADAADNLIDNRPSKGPAADMLRSQDHSLIYVQAQDDESVGEAFSRLLREERNKPVYLTSPKPMTITYRGYDLSSGVDYAVEQVLDTATGRSSYRMHRVDECWKGFNARGREHLIGCDRYRDGLPHA